MAYDLTGMANNTTGILSLTQNVNDVLMFGWLGVLFLIGLSFVVLTSLLFTTGDTKRSIAATAFISFGFALFLRAVSLLPDIAIYVTLVLAASSIALTWRNN